MVFERLSDSVIPTWTQQENKRHGMKSLTQFSRAIRCTCFTHSLPGPQRFQTSFESHRNLRYQNYVRPQLVWDQTTSQRRLRAGPWVWPHQPASAVAPFLVLSWWFWLVLSDFGSVPFWVGNVQKQRPRNPAKVTLSGHLWVVKVSNTWP